MGGWGDQGAQGPAFLADSGACLGHCYFNVPAGGAGLLSMC